MPEAINPKYKVWDEVVVVDGSEGYYDSINLFWFFGLKNKEYNEDFENGLKAKIVGVCKRVDAPYNVYHLRDSNGNECVIGEEGIKLAGIDKQEWFDAASRLFDSWMNISGGYVPKEGDRCYTVAYHRRDKKFTFNSLVSNIDCPFNFETLEQHNQFLSENEKDLKTFFHQV
jgi:hypothetical protein